MRPEAIDLVVTENDLPLSAWLGVLGLNGSGMLVVNPPYQLDEQLRASLPWRWLCGRTGRAWNSLE